MEIKVTPLGAGQGKFNTKFNSYKVKLNKQFNHKMLVVAAF